MTVGQRPELLADGFVQLGAFGEYLLHVLDEQLVLRRDHTGAYVFSQGGIKGLVKKVGY